MTKTNNPPETSFFKNQLNPAQAQAVTHTKGPLLILAGAGSGKTRVLTYRMAELILKAEATATEILCVTFTNKAAREMKERIHAILKDLDVPLHEPLWVSTFHAFCVKILRSSIHLLDYSPHFLIYDQTDQLNTIKNVIERLNLNPDIVDHKEVQKFIQKAKTLGLKPSSKKISYLANQNQIAVYKAYEEELKSTNALDFNDLLMKCYELFKNHPETLEAYQNQFRYIMIDEYQDTNNIQYRLIKLLAKKHNNICAVGDEDQSIYSWRGADYTNIINFKKDFPKAKVIFLEENYRSSQNIVQAASHLISKNQDRNPKKLFTQNPHGDKVAIHQLKNEYEEARFVAENISEEIQHRALKEIAVFYRTNAQSRILEEEMMRQGLKYKIVGGMQFYQRKEIKDMLAYIRLVLNPKDNVALQRVFNTPQRGLGKTTLAKLESYSQERLCSFYEAIPQALNTDLFNAGTRKKLKAFYDLIERLRSFHSEVKIPNQVYLKILEETQYIDALKEKKPLEAKAKSENLEALYSAIESFERTHKKEAHLNLFLEELALVSDHEDSEEADEDCVHMMTLHASKGLEFPVVFIVGCDEGLFPSSQALNALDNEKLLEEERRLAYVGVTRAQEKLFLCYTHTRRHWGAETLSSPSRFLSELCEEHIEHYPLNFERFNHENSFRPRKKTFFSKKSLKPSHRLSEEPEWFQPMPTYEDFSDETQEDSSTWRVGMKVKHPRFGTGTISQIEGEGEAQKLFICFRNQMTKKFLSKYTKLEIC